jgi:hypothetical protein
MTKINRTYTIIFSLFFFITSINLAYTNSKKSFFLPLQKYLLPNEHPLQSSLKRIFKRSSMFNNPIEFQHAGFHVLERVHRGLMVATHPSIKGYMFKKFQKSTSLADQLENYLKRIDGARALSDFISEKNLHYIVVPKKWLYRLPKKFSDQKTNEAAYILIVEHIDICEGNADPSGENALKYFCIDDQVLQELCQILYRFRGLDSKLHNLPFTHQGQIAFIDTERWERKREGYLSQIIPFLSLEKQSFALSLFQTLDES